MPRRKLNTDDLILNAYKYFTTEKNNCDPLRSPNQVHKRTTDALQISDTKLKSVLKQSNSEDNSVKAKPKYKNRIQMKTVDAPKSHKIEVRNLIYSMYAEKKHITLNSLLAEIRAKQILEIGRSSIAELLKGIGVKFVKDNNRRALYEKRSVVTMRIRFLREYLTLKKGANFVFLDETWIFSKGGQKSSWQDNSHKSVKNSGVGVRYIVLHAGCEDGFIEGAYLLFSSTSKNEDYHDSMNGTL